MEALLHYLQKHRVKIKIVQLLKIIMRNSKKSRDVPTSNLYNSSHWNYFDVLMDLYLIYHIYDGGEFIMGMTYN